jgi:formylglycine-generating enzyme required for sulfatase activity
VACTIAHRGDEGPAAAHDWRSRQAFPDPTGNVWEWCADGYAATYYKQLQVDDPPGTGLAAPGVYRACGYYDHPGYARSAVRYPRPPQFRSNVVGFRLALVPDPPG